jgi:hypothetical protein
VIVMALKLSIRASDRDRDCVVRLLREQTALGRLTPAEFEERMSAALVARTWEDLDGLTTDLPVSPPLPGRYDRPTHGRRRRVDWSDVGHWALFASPLVALALSWLLGASALLLLAFVLAFVVVVIAD